MNAELARADRAAAVRSAARSWRKAGAIDAETLARIEAAVPDDRVRTGPAFRALLFVFTLVAVNAGFGILVLFLPSGKEGLYAALGLLCGLGLAALTEVQISLLRRREGGTEAATSLMAMVYLMGALAWWVYEPLKLGFWTGLLVLGLALIGLCLAAAWRWGYPLYAAVAAATVMLLLARFPQGRLLWIAVPLVAAPLLLRASESPRLPPAHRASASAALAVGIAALYVAVNLASWDHRLLEMIRDGELLPPAGPGISSWLTAIATAVVPAALLALGIRRRNRLLLALGTVTAVASVVTFQAYVDLGPLWLVVLVSGAFLVGLVAVLRRWLDAGPDQERRGFTAQPLFADLDRQSLLEAGAALLTVSPHARPLPEPAPEPGFAGGGGDFGGGGSNAEF